MKVSAWSLRAVGCQVANPQCLFCGLQVHGEYRTGKSQLCMTLVSKNNKQPNRLQISSPPKHTHTHTHTRTHTHTHTHTRMNTNRNTNLASIGAVHLGSGASRGGQLLWRQSDLH